MSVTEDEPGWGRDDRLWRPDLPIVWLAMGLAGFGVVVLQSRVTSAFAIELSAASLAAVTWTIYAVPFVVLVVLLDLLEPEPPAFLASAFGWGALVATPVALVANRSGQEALAAARGHSFAIEWSGAIVAPVTEEVLKTLGVVVVVIVARRQVTTILDGIVYGAFVGLGFQVAENFLYTTDALRGGLFGRPPGQVVLDTFVGRGLELGLWSHVVYTALAGFGVAYAVVAVERGLARRLSVAIGTVLLAWGVHAVWNAPFTQVPADASTWQELGIYAAKGTPALLLCLALVWFAGRREVVWFAIALADEPPDVVTTDEREVLRTRRARRAVVDSARRAGGTRAAAAARLLHAAQVELAVCKATGGDEASLGAARRRVGAARTSLLASLEAPRASAS